MQIADLSDVNTQTFGDWQKDYLYKVLILSEPSAPGFSSLKGPFNKDTIDVYVEASPLPGSKISVQRRKFQGQVANFPTKLESANTVSFDFYYDESNLLHRFFTACRQLTGADDSAAMVPKDQYVFDIGLVLYKGDKTTAGKAYRLKNAWVADVSDLSLDKTKDGLLKFTVVFAYDKKQPLVAE